MENLRRIHTTGSTETVTSNLSQTDTRLHLSVPSSAKRPRSTSMQKLSSYKVLERNSSTRKSIFLNDEYGESQGNLENKECEEAISDDTHDKVEVVPADKAFAKSEAFRYISDSKKMYAIRYKPDGTFRGKFADLNFQARESILDREVRWGHNSFYGLYVAMWFGVAVVSLNIVLSYYEKHGSWFHSKVLITMVTDIWEVGITDLAMYLCTYFPVLLHKSIKHGWLHWRHAGRALQSIFEVVFVVFFLIHADARNYPWIGKIFLMLHSTVLLMKMHSYAFYNGYMWDISDELAVSKSYLKKHGEDLNSDVAQKLQNSVSFCQFELAVQAKTVAFPKNITYRDFFWYSCFPVLVYEPSYPRTKKIRWGYFWSKVAGIFGVICALIAISQNNMYPIVMKCLHLQQTVTLTARLKAYPFIIIEIIPPFLIIYMLVFVLIWDLILNAIAELSCFADREFYRYWWNSTEWDQYSRDWNVPVHKFLLRHVYHSTISAFQVSKTAATFITFLLSSVVHEVAMYVLFRKVRFYLLILQMCQLPLVQISRMKSVRNNPVLLNAVFWFGLVFGPSLMCTMYLVF